MARIPRQATDNGWIHVMNRGARRLPIFGDDADREAFLRRVADAQAAHGLGIHAYALMPNHFHLLVHGPVDALSRTMKHICGGYTQRFNTKYGLDGALLRGRYRSKPVDSDRYLHQVVRYIHRNPLEHDESTDPAAFRWTSHPAYSCVVPRPEWLTTRLVLTRFANDIAAYRAFVEGPAAADPGGSHEEAGLMRTPRVALPDDIESALGVNSAVERDLLRRGGRGVRNDLRLACVLLCAEITASTADGIAERYGFRSGSSVRSAVSQARRLLRTDPAFRATVDAAREIVTSRVWTGV